MIAPFGRDAEWSNQTTRFLPVTTSTAPTAIATYPTMGGTTPRSCDVTLSGPTSTSLLLLV
jgi:hypothetical protein